METISGSTLLDFLNADRRPTFVLSMATQGQQPWRASLALCNPALLAARTLRDEIIQGFETSTNSINGRHLDHATNAFTTWVTDMATRPTDLGLDATRVMWGLVWTCTVIRDSVVVSGTEIPANPALQSESERHTTPNGSVEAPLSSRKTGKTRPISSSSYTTTKPALVELGAIWGSATSPVSSHLKFIRNFDWASHPLGPIETWSPQLRQACEMMLTDADPATLFWGDQLYMIYNEPYVAIAGSKHPSLLGGSSRIHYAEVWDQYEALFAQMRVDGKAFKQANAQLFLRRNGMLEEAYFNMVVMPVLEEGRVVGFYQSVAEVTKQVLSERRMHTLLHVSEKMSRVTSFQELSTQLLDALRGHGMDTHFAILYSQETCLGSADGSEIYTFEGAIGFDKNATPFPRVLDLTANAGNQTALGVAFQKAQASSGPMVLQRAQQNLTANLLDELQSCGMNEPCQTVVISALKSGANDDPCTIAFVAIGINPRRPYDEDYRLFIQLLTGQIESTITFVNLFEREKERLKKQAAQESDLRFRRFAERAPVGIYIFDAKGNVTFCNDRWLELSGLDRSEVDTVRSWVNTVHPDNLEEIRGYWEKLAGLEGPQTFEVQYKKPWRPPQGQDGAGLDRTYGIASAYAEVSAEGQLTGILGCVTDISHQKWAESMQAQRLTEALELKRQQENFLDITSHEMRNPLNAIIHCAHELVDLLTEYTTSGLSMDERSNKLVDCLDASQTIIYCSLHQKRIIDDVLTLSKLDSNLLSVCPISKRPLDIVNEVLKVFDSELRTTKISTTTEFGESYQDLNINLVLLDPYRVIQILINLIANAVKFTKGEAFRHLRILLNASLQEPTSETAGVRYVPSGRHRKDPTSHPDWGKGEVIYLHFSVVDTGPGMTQDEANLLFHRFAQASPRTHAQYGGSGLGLFISRELAELHGGRIGISSQLGSGSTFDFYIKARRDITPTGTKDNRRTLPLAGKRRPTRPAYGPLSNQPRKTNSSPSVLQQPLPWPSLNVLIVEDNLVNQRILTKILRKHGYEVSIANNGEEALSVVKASKWAISQTEVADAVKLDLVLMDLEMPVMDGKTACVKIRTLQKEGQLYDNIPVIAVTGNARSQQINEAKECGFDDVVVKPYQVDELLERVQRFAGSFEG